MTPQKQLLRHKPEEGIWGDCFRTAIACLLDLPPADVPHIFDQGALTDTAYPALREWLSARGLCRIAVPFAGADLDGLLASMKVHCPGIYYLLSGKSRNGCNHTVICLEDKIAHDPSQDESGIVGPCLEDDLYWLEFIGAGVATDHGRNRDAA